MCGNVGKAVVYIDATGPSCKACGEAALPRRVRRQACGSIAPVRAQRLRIRPRLQRVGLHQLLPRQRTLLARVADLFAPLHPLRRGKAEQFAILAPAHCALST